MVLMTSTVQLSYYITTTNIGLLLLGFISMYLVTFLPPSSPESQAQSSIPSHQAQRPKILTEKELLSQKRQSFWERWAGCGPPQCFVHICYFP